LTPQVKDIVVSVVKKIFLPWRKMATLKDMAKEMESPTANYLTKREKTLKNVNIVITDFPSYDFVHRVVKTNILEPE